MSRSYFSAPWRRRFFQKDRIVARLLLASLPMLVAGTLVVPAPTAAYNSGSQPLSDVVTAAGHHLCGGLTSNGLAAMALAVTYEETGAGSTNTPSPMTLSRWDNGAGLHESGSTSTPYQQAFWHPGVGMFQLDSAGLGTNLGAHDAILTSSAADVVTKQIASAYCRAGGTTAQKRAAGWGPWVACRTGRCETAYQSLYQGGSVLVNLDPAVDRTGGMLQRTCQRGGVSFTCWYVDPQRAQGYAPWNRPGFGPSPVSLPFYVFNSSAGEERHWLRADTGYPVNISAVRRFGTNARSSLRWARTSDVTVLLTPPPPPTPPGHEAPLSAGRDFNGDGYDDIFWYGPGSGPENLWLGTGTRNQFTKRQTTSIGGDYIPVAGDFNGDHKTDIIWYAPGNAAEYLWVWIGQPNSDFYFGLPKNTAGNTLSASGGYTPIPGDFDADGKDDIFWYSLTGGTDFVWYGGANGFTDVQTLQVSRSDLTPIPGDFDGDGRTDIFWYAPGGESDALWRGSATRTFFPVTTQNVYGDYSPVAGDFNADGYDDIYWYAVGTGNDTLSLGTGTAGLFTTNRANDVTSLYWPIAGNFNGDKTNGHRRDDILWYQPGTGADSLWSSYGSGSFANDPETINGDYRPT